MHLQRAGTETTVSLDSTQGQRGYPQYVVCKKGVSLRFLGLPFPL